MAIVKEEDVQQEFNPPKKKPPTEDEKRKKKIVAGSLMKALIRPGGGADSRPSDADQVCFCIIWKIVLLKFSWWLMKFNSYIYSLTTCGKWVNHK